MNIKSLIRLSVFFLIVVSVASCKDDDDSPQPSQSYLIAADTVSFERIISDTTLVNRGKGIDYIISSKVDIYKKLTIEPGVRIAFTQEGGLSMKVNRNTSDSGIIHAVGTATDSIWFQGLNGVKWESIDIGTPSPLNKLHYCVVKDAAGTGAITTYGDGMFGDVELKYSSIRNNEDYGLYSFYLSSIEGFEKNTFHSNGGYPIHIGFSSLPHLDGQQSSYYNNGSGTAPKDMIYVSSDNLYDRQLVGGDFVIKDPGVPILIKDRVYLRDDASLTVEAGNELVFDNYEVNTAGANSSVSIEGTAKNPVIIRSIDDYHHWGGFLITTDNPNNKIEHTKIIDGGDIAMGDHSNGAGISLGSSSGPAQLSLNNVEIISSKGCGISEVGSTTLNTSNVTFVNNNGSDYCN